MYVQIVCRYQSVVSVHMYMILLIHNNIFIIYVTWLCMLLFIKEGNVWMCTVHTYIIYVTDIIDIND
jgi:hypothetical protein